MKKENQKTFQVKKSKNISKRKIDIIEAMKRYKFYHIITLTDSISTPGAPEYVPIQNLCMKYLKTIEIKGKRVLDIGCRDGLFSFAAEKLGASKVVGIDNDLSIPATEFLIPFFKSKVIMKQMNLYDLKPRNFGLFDIVVFPGVLYHLRYPFWALKVIRDVLKVGGRLLIETAIWKGDPENSLLFCPIGNESPYEGTSCTYYNQKGLIDTLSSLGFETEAVEWLDHEAEKQYNNPVTVIPKRPKIKDLFSPPQLPKNNKIGTESITRCVISTVYRGMNKDSFTAHYWESTHSYHSQHGA